MDARTFSSRNFTRDFSAAKRAAAAGPVFITTRGRPAYALLTIEDYHRLSGRQATSLLDLLDAIAGGDGVAFETYRLNLELPPVDLS